MTEIKLTKRYPNSRTEDITDAYMRGWNDALDAVQYGKFIIKDDRKTEPSGYKMKPIEQTEPQIRLDKDNKTLWIKNTLDGYDRVIVEEDVFCRIFYEDCGECAHNKTEPQTNERLKRLQACIDCEHTDMCEWCHTRWSKTEQTKREGE